MEIYNILSGLNAMDNLCCHYQQRSGGCYEQYWVSISAIHIVSESQI